MVGSLQIPLPGAQPARRSPPLRSSSGASSVLALPPRATFCLPRVEQQQTCPIESCAHPRPGPSGGTSLPGWLCHLPSSAANPALSGSECSGRHPAWHPPCHFPAGTARPILSRQCDQSCPLQTFSYDKVQSPAPILLPCSTGSGQAPRAVLLAVAQLLFPKGTCPRSRGRVHKVMKETQHPTLLPLSCLSICLSIHLPIHPFVQSAEPCAVLGTWSRT